MTDAEKRDLEVKELAACYLILTGLADAVALDKPDALRNLQAWVRGPKTSRGWFSPDEVRVLADALPATNLHHTWCWTCDAHPVAHRTGCNCGGDKRIRANELLKRRGYRDE